MKKASTNLPLLVTAGIVIGCFGWDLIKRVSTRHNRGIAKGKRFLIVGGGFAGVEVSRGLERLLPGDNNGEIILVDENGFLLFTPMLTEAVGGMVNPSHIIVPLASYTHRTRILREVVKSIDLQSRSIRVGEGEGHTVAADYLVIALGATSNFHSAPGVEQNAFPVKTLEDANRIREGALQLLEDAMDEHDELERKAMVTFVVAGGGYTGVETIAALNDLLRDTAMRRGEAVASEIRMLLVEPMSRLMTEVTEDLGRYTQRQLENDGVEVRLQTGIKSAGQGWVELTNGEKIRTRMLIWSAGIEASKQVSSLPEASGKLKTLRVRADLSLPEFEGVWVVGDSAEVPQGGGKHVYGATAQNATREGQLVAANIVRTLRGEESKPFRYTPIGELALIGRRRGVARIYNLNFSGLTAYVLWRLVYVAKLPTVKQRLRVLGDWMLDALFGPVTELDKTPVKTRAKHLESRPGQPTAS